MNLINIKKGNYCNNIIKRIPVTIFMIVSFFLTQSYFGTSNYGLIGKVYVFEGILVCFFIIAKGKGKIVIKTFEKKLALMLIAPYICMFLYSLFLSIFEKEITIKHAFSESMIPILMPIAAVCIYRYFYKNIVEAIFYAAIINYTFYVIAFIRIHGIKGLLTFIILTENAPLGEKPLEVHELTFIFALLIIYYIWNWNNEKNKIKLFISSIYCILGYKRILILGVILALVFHIIFKKIDSRRKKKNFLNIIVILMLLFSIFWIYASATTFFVDVAQKFNIELSGRGEITDVLKGYYDLSILYIGKGIGFVHQTMLDYLNYNKYAVTSGFHNDILRYYIDLGFVPCVLYFGYIIVVCMNKLSKLFSIEIAEGYIMFLIMTIICWMTDNLSTYPNYLFVFNILVLHIAYSEKIYLNKKLEKSID